MSWQMAVVGAIGAAQYQQQGAIGKYNQAVANRNALVKEQEALKQTIRRAVQPPQEYNPFAGCY